MEKYIAFVGDSFCGFTNSPRTNLYGFPQGSVQTPPSYTSLVADHYGYGESLHGYCGRSWWYSWVRFYNEWQDKLDQLEAIIFCHTHANRINNSENHDLPHMVSDHIFSLFNRDDLARACETYYKHILDVDFNAWAQQQYFKMLREKFSSVKTIHFHCFRDTLPWSDLLPGVVYTTCLMHVAIGEEIGTSQQILDATGDQSKANHFNEHNNRALAGVIIDTLDDYKPGQYEIPLAGFDQPNQNAKNWPDGKFWTK